MISHISGRLRSKDEEELTVEVEVDGMSYEVHLPVFAWRAIEPVREGEPIELETFYYVAERQPIPKLVGFTRDIERRFFRKFIGVPKLGPTVALKAMVFSVSTIAGWIENEDANALARLPGIGKRMATTIVAHLKGKVIEEALLQDERFDEPPAPSETPSVSEAKEYAIQGLVRLGYKEAEATRWVEEITRDQALEKVEDIIRAVFRMQSEAL
jgi:Holliday junction DNA helicase RuvA